MKDFPQTLRNCARLQQAPTAMLADALQLLRSAPKVFRHCWAHADWKDAGSRLGLLLPAESASFAVCIDVSAERRGSAGWKSYSQEELQEQSREADEHAASRAIPALTIHASFGRPSKCKGMETEQQMETEGSSAAVQ
ncbi:unnamed protein product [Polarella glacialis]|uniref:Uncharacterized protein n=1 Tax=Polarella glacialis TaxID=89957 RepID=A0A813FHI4_POLGL|nr:unnamed protein product [Polarella glacialis]